MIETSQGVELSQYLTFLIAGEEYAVGILKVREIIQYDTLTRVPKTPAWIRGVVNLRGGVVPVVDLAVKLGLPETEITPTTCIVMTEVDIEGETSVMGVLADSVSQVIELRGDDIEPPPTFGTRVNVDYLLGMGKADKKFVMLLDIDRVLSVQELLTCEGAREEAELDGAGSSVPEVPLTPEPSPPAEVEADGQGVP